MWFGIYKATGELRYQVELPDGAESPIFPEGDDIGIGLQEPHDGLYLKNGMLKPYPARPSNVHRFDHDQESWIDPRTTEDLLRELAQLRSITFLDKSELLSRLLIAKRISADDMRTASLGDMPPALAAVVADWPEEAQVIAETRWRLDQRLGRSSPMTQLLAHAFAISDAAMDDIFGITAPTTSP